MAGLVGTLDQWAVFEGAWAKALAADGREYIHMREHREYVTDPTLLGPYVQAIESAGPFGVGHFVVLPHLGALNAERKCRVCRRIPSRYMDASWKWLIASLIASIFWPTEATRSENASRCPWIMLAQTVSIAMIGGR
jgi:hypothetical protein